MDGTPRALTVWWYLSLLHLGLPTTVLNGLDVHPEYIFRLGKSLTECFLSQQAPSSLLEALEQHLASLEGKKVKDSTAASRYINSSPVSEHLEFQRRFTVRVGINTAIIGVSPPAGPALSPTRCLPWPARGCRSPKWTSGRSRRRWRRSRPGSKPSR